MLSIVAAHNKNKNTNNVVSYMFYLFEGLLLNFWLGAGEGYELKKILYIYINANNQ